MREKIKDKGTGGGGGETKEPTESRYFICPVQLSPLHLEHLI